MHHPTQSNCKMEQITFPVYFNLKIPLLTKALFYLFIICVIILLLFGLYMLPSEGSGDEMRAAYYIMTASEIEKALFLIGLFGAPTFFLLHKYLRIHQRGLLILLPDKIEFSYSKKVISYSTKEITHIACNDPLTADGDPKGPLTIDFRHKGEKVISVMLSDYNQSDEVMNALLNYENIKFDVTNFTSNPGLLDMY